MDLRRLGDDPASALAGRKMTVVILFLAAIMIPVWCKEDMKEYCQFETFEAECPEGGVIVMTHARYGRMRLGRCVVADLGYVGCTTDVLHLADRRCSGRRKCKIPIPDEGFDGISTCLTELKKYFEASYKCVKVTSTSPSVCSVCNYGVKLSAPSGRIASVVAEETGCGTPDCPWIIEAEPGQRVNLSITDFALSRASSRSAAAAHSGSASCRVYATIKEETVTRSFTVCGGDARERHVYTSLTNTVEVRIVGQPSSDAGRDHFLLSYQAVGCPDPHQPAYGWSKRSGSRAILGCNETGDKWELVCKDGRWVGKPGNCSSGAGGIFAHSVLGTGNMPSGLSIVVILAVAVVIGLVIFIVGLIVLKSRQSRTRRPPTAQQIHGSDAEAPYMKTAYDPRHSTAADLDDKSMLPGRDKNEYAHIWEMPLPQPRGAGTGTGPGLGNGAGNGTVDRPGTMERNGGGGGGAGGGGVSSGTYGYRSSTLPAYPIVPLSAHEQNYGNSTLARLDHHGEFIEREEDPRYFQLDPEVESLDH